MPQGCQGKGAGLQAPGWLMIPKQASARRHILNLNPEPENVQLPRRLEWLQGVHPGSGQTGSFPILCSWDDIGRELSWPPRKCWWTWQADRKEESLSSDPGLPALPWGEPGTGGRIFPNFKRPELPGMSRSMTLHVKLQRTEAQTVAGILSCIQKSFIHFKI